MKEIFKKPQNWINLVILGSISVFLILHFSSKTKMGYVRSNELVYGYQGMKEANIIQEEKTKQLKSNIDTLQMDLQKVISQYNFEFSSLSVSERLEKEKLISIQQDNLKQYAKNAENTVKQSDLDLTTGILNQINSLVEICLVSKRKPPATVIVFLKDFCGFCPPCPCHRNYLYPGG